MNKFIILSLLLIPACGAKLAAEDRALYGNDDRQDIYQVGNRMFVEKQRSVAAMISADNINGAELSGGPLSEIVCPGEKFAAQPMVAKCTGFLVKEDLIVTAGHCVVTPEDCRNSKWVFGFYTARADQNKYTISAEDVYSCVQVVEREYSNDGDIDHAVVRLDRPVRNRPPLSYRTGGALDSGSQLALIGYPSGLPAKVVLNGSNLDNTNPYYFASDLDSFGGDSGAPVFDQKTGDVEGIQTRGQADYIFAPGQNCKVPKVCQPVECFTSKAGRITNVKLLRPRH